MTFLPVVTRELRVAARKPRTFWVRFFMALVAILLFFWIWFAFGQAFGAGRQGSSLFSGLSGFAMAYALFMGASTSDSISEEKRNGTLGLLFLTDLRGFDVVLGKLAATSLNLFYGLIAIFPLLALPLLLGGVTVGEFWRMVLVLSVTLLFSLSCGMFCSAFSLSDRRARSATVLLILFLAVIVPFLYSLRNRFMPSQDNYWLWATPTFTYTLSFDSAYARSFHDYWCSISVLIGLSMLLLAIASFAVPRLWQDRPTGPRGTRWCQGFGRWVTRKPGLRAEGRARMLDLNPYFWLASRPMRKRLYPIFFLALAAVTWLWLNHKYPRDMHETFIYVITMLALHTSIKSWVASEASRLFSQDRLSGAWELTLSTPLAVSEIIKGQSLALIRQFIVPCIIILAADISMTFVGAPNGQTRGEDYSWITVCIAGMIVFVADLVAISWVGMWLGVRSAKPGKAVTGTIVRILALPWILFVGICSLSSITRVTISFTPTWQMVLGLWVFLTLGVDLIFGVGSARNLHRYFRGFATTRFETVSSFYGKRSGQPWMPIKAHTPGAPVESLDQR